MPFKKGHKHGKGREKGSKNKRTIGREAVEDAMANSKVLPLEFMLNKLNDPESEEGERMWAAEKAGPYCHSKAVEYKDIALSGIRTVSDIVDELEHGDED